MAAVAVVAGLVGLGLAPAATAAVAGGWAAGVPSTGLAAPPRQVWVQGDSVMLGAAPDTAAALAGAGWAAIVAAFEGLSLPAATSQLAQNQASLGSVVVLELGANDFGDPPAFGQQIDQAMAVIGNRHVVWLTVSHFNPAADALNAEIYQAALRWPNLTVADWASVVDANPNTVYSDGLHLTPIGYQLMATFVLDHVTAWYDQVAGPSRPLVVGVGSGGGGTSILGYTNGAPRAVVADPAGPGYWVVGSDGGIASIGGARFFGSTGAVRLNRPIVGMAARPSGAGYWLVASDGGIFTFGDAGFYGSTGAMRLNRPIIGMASTPDGRGYWLIASDGGIFTFGDARYLGSGVGTSVPLDPAVPALGAEPASFVGIALARGGNGYWLLGEPGG